MAVYKVPQDVEADDKLIGPFSFRQFIYLIIVAVSIALAWGLSRLFIPLAIIPLPLILFFGALALPLKKDQPMEIYLAAIVSFYLKPRKRLWETDGIQSLVEITAPKVTEVQRTKNLSQGEAEQRLSYLANIVDTGGWAVRGVASAPNPNTAMNTDLYFEAQQATDVLDENTGVGLTFDTKLAQADSQRRQDMMNRMHQPQLQTPSSFTQPTQTPVPQSISQDDNSGSQYTGSPPSLPVDDIKVSYNPYPNAIHQSVIQPINNQTINPNPTTPAPIQTTTSEKSVSPDIINLANNPDLSIETIAHEADRIHQKEAKLAEDEVVISLR